MANTQRCIQHSITLSAFASNFKSYTITMGNNSISTGMCSVSDSASAVPNYYNDHP